MSGILQTTQINVTTGKNLQGDYKVRLGQIYTLSW